MTRYWSPFTYRFVGVALAVLCTAVGVIAGRLTAPAVMPDDFSTRVGNLANEGKGDEILRLCSVVLERDPRHFDARWVRGGELRNRSRFSEAIDDLNIALKNEPNHPNAHHAFSIRVRCFGKLGQDEKAIADYDESIKRNPGYMWAYVWRGRSHDNLNHFRQALDDYRVFIDRAPEDPDVRLRAARLEIELGQFDAAEASLRIAKANAGNNGSVIGRADVLNGERLKRMARATPAGPSEADEPSPSNSAQ